MLRYKAQYHSRLVGWLVGWLVGSRQVGRLVGRLIGWIKVLLQFGIVKHSPIGTMETGGPEDLEM